MACVSFMNTNSVNTEETDDKPPLEGAGQSTPEVTTLVARVHGEVLTKIPQDLYIPPDALEVFLEQFSGPLDLLLYLIRRQNIDILDIPIVEVTNQYMQYIDLMQQMRFELAADYLLMAAMLAEIKSRMLLPRTSAAEDNEEDPRAELIRRLQQYERFARAANDLDQLDRVGRDVFTATAEIVLFQTQEKIIPKIEFDELIRVFGEVLKRAEMYSHHQIRREALSVRERMARVLEAVRGGDFVEFTSLFDFTEGRMGVVVTFLALLELIKESLLELVQTEAYAPIHVRAAVTGSEDITLLDP